MQTQTQSTLDDSTRVAFDTFPVQLSKTALTMALSALVETEGEDGDILRVSVKGGGCAGFQYALNFVKSADSLDIFTEKDGLKIVTDIFSSSHLTGTVIDYVETAQGAGFKFENPNAKRTCGCGSSFG